MKGRHVARAGGVRRALRIGIPLLAGLTVLGGGAAYAAYRYEASRAGRILPGVTIEGVAVGGMTREEAVAAVTPVAEEELYREIEVWAGDRTWHVRPAELGVAADVEAKVAAALAVSDSMPWHSRALRRLLDRPVDEALELAYTRAGDGIKRFLDVVEKAVYVSPTSARIELVDDALVVKKPRGGAELQVRPARSVLRQVLAAREEGVRLPVARLRPDVSGEDLGKTIVIRLSLNELYLYDGLKVSKTYDVATGQPAYPTPTGTWNIWDKRENPTWVNPAPDGWGSGLPRVIGPGPGNPLGTHALYLDAPGIRIHGTYDEGSIGSYASHGCIRMRLEEAKELFGIIDVGTQVLILR